MVTKGYSFAVSVLSAPRSVRPSLSTCPRCVHRQERRVLLHNRVTADSQKHDNRKRGNLASNTDPKGGSANPFTDGKDIAIVGGGLTGLTAAYYLAEGVNQSTKITIYEGSDRLGGWVRTDKVPVDVDGKKGTVSFERGPRSLSALSNSKSRFDDLVFYDLCIKLGLEPKVAPTDLRRFIYYPDRLVPVPPKGLKEWSAALQEPFYKQLFPAVFGYLKFMLKGRPRPGESDISISEFVRHVSGSQAAADNAASAIIGGIYGGNIDKLDAKTALYPMLQSLWISKDEIPRFPFFSAPKGVTPDEDAEFSRGTHAAVSSYTDSTVLAMIHDKAIQKMIAKIHLQDPSLLHFGSHGLQALTDALVGVLRNQPNVEIKTGCRVESLKDSLGKKKIQIKEQSGKSRAFDKVFATVGGRVLDLMTEGRLPTLKEMESVDIMTVNLWYPYSDLKPKGLGYLIPRSVSAQQNPERALGVFFDSDIGNGLPDEPEGTKLFVLLGGHYYDDPKVKIPTPEQAVAQAKSLLERHLGIPADLPCHAEANLRKECIPQHTVGHPGRMARLGREINKSFDGRLQPTGGAYTRIGAMAALRDGYTATRSAVVGLEDWETRIEMPGAGGMYLSVPDEVVSHARPNAYPLYEKCPLGPDTRVRHPRAAR